MGMHFGTIATTGTAEELLGGLARAGQFSAGAPLQSIEEAPETDENGEKVLVAGDHAGRAYLLDDALLLSTNLDLIADASVRLDRRVLAAGAETTSGTYFLIVADRGRVERVHWNQLGSLSEPYDVGVPLAGEPEDGLDDVDGRRLTAVLEAAGFDPDGWLQQGRKVVVEAVYGEPEPGAQAAAMNAFWEAHVVPGSDRLKPVVARRDEGYDLVAPGTRMPDGTRIADKDGKPGLLGRLFGRS